MSKTVFGFLAALLVSTSISHSAFCNPASQTPQISQKNFHDSGMDADEDQDDEPIPPESQQTADSLNKQSLEDSKPHPARTTVGIVYISVHVIDNIQDSDFLKVVASTRNAVNQLKKDNSEFKGKSLIQAVIKSMNDNHHQSDKFISLMRDYKVERPEDNDIVLDQLPETIGCAEDSGDDENSPPPSYCYSMTINPKLSHGRNSIALTGNTIWQGSDADNELDSDQYHIDLANTQTVWLYRGLPADAKGTKRFFIFEVTIAIDPNKMNDNHNEK